MIRIQYSGDGVERIRELAGTVRNPRGLMLVLGREAGNQLIKHFRTLDEEHPNKLGGERQHFWNEVSRSVNQPVLEDEKTVSIQIADRRFAQKLFGGPIRAVRVQNLAIPLTAQAYGMAPSVFERETGLKLFLIKKDDRALLAAKVEKAGVVVEYLLTPSVNQLPQADALPPESVMAEALVARAEKWAARQAAGGPPTS